MERFWFTGELPSPRSATLSGGERRRLQLLLVLAGRPNVLLLDEPTNDLDLDTLRILEDFLEDWPGALVVVSHDRTFLERTTDRLVAMGDGGHLEPVAGGVGAWVARVAEGASRPRARPPAGPPPSEAAPGRSAPAPPGGAGRRSASTLGRLLRESEKELARRRRECERLAAALAGAAGHEELARSGVALAEAQAGLEAAEERWLALAEEAESGPTPGGR